MNNIIEKKAKALNQWILDQDVVIEFKKYEQEIQKHPELLALENELKDLQKQIVLAKHEAKDCQDIINEYEMKYQRFENHPLVLNYLNLKEEVNALIHQIELDMNKELEKKVNEFSNKG